MAMPAGGEHRPYAREGMGVQMEVAVVEALDVPGIMTFALTLPEGDCLASLRSCEGVLR